MSTSQFLTLLPPPEARAHFLDHITATITAETVTTDAALGRITAATTIAPFALPTFARTTVDGYAVRATDTHGASASLPAYLKLIGEVPMGKSADLTITKGTCALIHTGGMLPEGADAVIMIEQTQRALSDEVELLRAVAEGENVLQIGEDVAAGSDVIAAGTRIRPAEIGGLMALGFTEIDVSRQPRVGILSSGDEVVTPGQPLATGQVYDVNSSTLQALVTQAGGIAQTYPIIADEPDAFRESAEKALAANDVVIFTAGSSVSVRDLTAQTIANLGAPGVLVHGVNVRPGKPTILAVCAGKPVIGLPGNPVSALVIAQLFVVPVIEQLLGVQKRRLQPAIQAQLSVNLASQSGREDWIAVRIIHENGQRVAEPVFGKSNLIFTLARADGLLRIHPDANGIAAGEIVSIIPL